jgi:hypothetical protein
MSTPAIYQGLTPTQTEGGLSSLQLAMAHDMMNGGAPFKVNQDFLLAMKKFASSEPLSPSTVDPVTGLPRQPDISTTTVGIAYKSIGDDIYLYRRASDCGPDENRYEKVFIGKRANIAAGTWAFYGKIVFGGTAVPPPYSPSDYGWGA